MSELRRLKNRLADEKSKLGGLEQEKRQLEREINETKNVITDIEKQIERIKED